MDYKETLNLPKTKFPMKANLVKKEPEMIEKWDKENLYHMIRESSKGRKRRCNLPYARPPPHILLTRDRCYPVIPQIFCRLFVKAKTRIAPGGGEPWRSVDAALSKARR